MEPTLDDLLGEPDEGTLCDRVHGRLVRALSALGVEPEHDEERLLVLTWDATGGLSNGGFQFLFEGRFWDRDPGYAHSLAGFAAVGAVEAHAAFREALARFPGVVPADPAERLRRWKQVPEGERERLNSRFWAGKPAYEAGLARWIRAHQARLETILRERLQRAPGDVDLDRVVQRLDHLRLVLPGVLEELAGERVVRRFDLAEWAVDVATARPGLVASLLARFTSAPRSGVWLALRRGDERVDLPGWDAMTERRFSFVATVVTASQQRRGERA